MNRRTLNKRTLVIALTLGLAGAGVALAGEETTVRVYDRTVTEGTTPIEIAGVERDLYDLDGDGFVDAVVSTRSELPVEATLDAIADAEWEDVQARTGSDEKDVAVDLGVATRDAAGVAATDRPGERVNPAHESRKIAAQAEGQAPDMDDPDLRVAHSEVIGVAAVPVAQRRIPAGLPADIERLEVTAVSHRVADLDGDGNADTLLTVRQEIDPDIALERIARVEDY